MHRFVREFIMNNYVLVLAASALIAAAPAYYAFQAQAEEERAAASVVTPPLPTPNETSLNNPASASESSAEGQDVAEQQYDCENIPEGTEPMAECAAQGLTPAVMIYDPAAAKSITSPPAE